MRNPFQSADTAESNSKGSPFALLENVRYPGLASSGREISILCEQLPKRLAVHRYKQSEPFLWVIFVGGTGTGKSTLFNALCGQDLSETGVERPKTCGPVVYAHRNTRLEKGLAFLANEIKTSSPEDAAFSASAGAPGQLQILEHRREAFAHLVLVDTPDLDSVEIRNRQAVEDLYLLSDVVVFVTSQEKYADEVPFQFLQRVHREGKFLFLLFNKAEARFSSEDAMASFRSQGLDAPEKRLWILPYVVPDPARSLAGDENFNAFLASFFNVLAIGEVPDLLGRERARNARELKDRIRLVIDLLGREQRAAQKWLEQLEVFFREACDQLLEREEKHFNVESREYLQAEIRRLYGRYDVLGKPRRLVSRVLMSPLRLLGLGGGKPRETHEEALLRIRRKIDLVPIHGAMEGFNRIVLEQLSPTDDTSPLFKMLRAEAIALSREEVKQKVWEEQERLSQWLGETFQKMAEGIPKSKEWGIYSTSILWGALIVSFEAAIGGGISLFEAALDSALAPFVTKGAVELFAYHELQKIARELVQRYQEALLSVLRSQRDRYAELMKSLMTSEESIAALRAYERSV